MPSSPFLAQLRATLEFQTSVADVLLAAEDFSNACALDPEHASQLDEHLRQIYDELVDHGSVHHAQVFLGVLYHLRHILPFDSIASWFEYLLRPALRDARLPTSAVDHAKQLIICAANNAAEFRSRLMDLYLLDAFNAAGSADILEWAELEPHERTRKTSWKSNLEDILLIYGQEHPLELLNEMHEHFNPDSRLQLLILINLFTSMPSFLSAAKITATHPLMTSLLNSLLFDKSTTACQIALTIVVKLLPIFAVTAREQLKELLPQLFVVLARVLCWPERPPTIAPQSPEGETLPLDAATATADVEDASNRLVIRDELSWTVLEQSFDGATSVPSPRGCFTLLYYLFPCNVLRFLRQPVLYLNQSCLPCPWTVDWNVALDEQKIRSKSETLLRTHSCHPLIIWRDAAEELSMDDFWDKYGVAQIVTEAMMLDVRKPDHAGSSPAEGEDISRGTSTRRGQISLQDMISTSVLLKSQLDVDVLPTREQWPDGLLNTLPASTVRAHSEGQLPQQAIAALQREVLLLRSELNFELWLGRENVKHIARLHQTTMLSRDAESERQGLYNNLRRLRKTVADLEQKLQQNQSVASSTKERFVDYNGDLQKRLHELREQKKSWTKEAEELRRADAEKTAQFDAQRRLLADANSELALLQTQKKASQHKIDRLHDYERQIERHVEIQRLWDADFEKFTAREEEVVQLKSECERMRLRLQSYEQSETDTEDRNRALRRQAQTLEAQLAQERRTRERPSWRGEHVAELAKEKKELVAANTELLGKISNLVDELEEFQAMVEMLKGRPISDPRASPVHHISL
ncbi:HATPase-c domain-containing protein [Mycena kentingensis (nom. inval.)]|nr:HATPase-c domain-containing protein [Mycena kentingensis (nom. inval.)]